MMWVSRIISKSVAAVRFSLSSSSVVCTTWDMIAVDGGGEVEQPRPEQLQPVLLGAQAQRRSIVGSLARQDRGQTPCPSILSSRFASNVCEADCLEGPE